VPRRDIVVLGASAGGIEVLTRVLKDAGGIDAAFVVVVHLAADAPTVLPHIVTRATGLPSRFAEDGEELVSGTVLIAPPGRHTLVCRGTVAVVNAPRENRSRPAIDPLFRSAAAAYGPRVIAVALSGVLDDGTAGAGAVRRNGGLVVVQSPEDALFPGIPTNIIEHAGADHVRPSAEIGALLRTLTGEEVEDRTAAADVTDPALADQRTLLAQAERGTLTHFTCPECSGTLWEVDEHGVLRYRCRVGHVYSPDALAAAAADRVETALWVATRVLEEQAGLVRRTAERSRALNTPSAASRLERRAREIDARIEVIREVLDHLAAVREEEVEALSPSGSA
jgi:two-component system, chemotaxis family, protein-glutamate methylesterase/glutaminase